MREPKARSSKPPACIILKPIYSEAQSTESNLKWSISEVLLLAIRGLFPGFVLPLLVA